MKRSIAVFGTMLALILSAAAHAADPWQAGRHYFLVSPPQRTSVPAGKIEVAEVFSYGCPFCAQILPVIHKLKAALPANAQLVYLPASFLPNEDWPMYQRAFFTAQALGILEKTHEAMFDAVWKTGELAFADPTTHKFKSPLPGIEDAAKIYAKVAGVKEADFLAASKSFGVDAKMRGADAFVKATQSLSTPTFIVNGKYRLDASSAGSYDNVIEVVKFLIAKESAGH
jgi:thiol:disulfide interchange protein DsbA